LFGLLRAESASGRQDVFEEIGMVVFGVRSNAGRGFVWLN
jgi:hypothetical protein